MPPLIAGWKRVPAPSAQSTILNVSCDVSRECCTGGGIYGQTIMKK